MDKDYNNTAEIMKSIDDFWNLPAEDFEYDEQELKIIRKIKKICAAAFVFFVTICIIVILCLSVKKLSENAVEKQLYELALMEIGSGSYQSAVSHLKNIYESSRYYESSSSYVKKLENAEIFYNKALKYYEAGSLGLAREKLEAISLVIDEYKPAEELRHKIDLEYKRLEAQAAKTLERVNDYIKSGDYVNAIKEYNNIAALAPQNTEIADAYNKIRAYCLKRINEGMELYKSLDFQSALAALNEVNAILPNMEELSAIKTALESYSEASALAELAEENMQLRNYAEAKKLIDAAIDRNPLISGQYSSLADAVNNSAAINEKGLELAKNIKISNVQSFDNENKENQISIMFEIENIGNELREFNLFWCSLYKDGEELYPVAENEQRLGIVIKILSDGALSSELEYDYFYIDKGEKYQVMLSFEGQKEVLNGAVLYYCDYNAGEDAMIDLARIS